LAGFSAPCSSSVSSMSLLSAMSRPMDAVSTSETRSRPSPKRHSLLAQLSAPRDAQRGDSWSFCFPRARLPPTAGSQRLPTHHWGRPRSEDLQYQPAPQPSGSCWILLRQHPSVRQPLNALWTRRLVARVFVQPRARRSELGRVPPMCAPRPTLGRSGHQRAIKPPRRWLSRQWPWLLGSFSRLGHKPIRDGSSWRDAFYSTCALSPACPTQLP
jgi:hypothetical protein